MRNVRVSFGVDADSPPEQIAFVVEDSHSEAASAERIVDGHVLAALPETFVEGTE